ncbi:MAG: proline dehydrogenase family protein [Actinomycetes bacterium]
MALFDRAIVKALPAVPKPIVRRLSAPYIAGPSLEDAVRVVSRLNVAGKLATIDVLGEAVTSIAESQEIARSYHQVLARIESEKLDANVSIKLTGLGLHVDAEHCRENLTDVAEDARVRGNFVRIDMEDSSTTGATLGLYRGLRAGGHENVGVVLQARLRRTLTDIDGLANVRLCKGIYVEPSEIAFQAENEIRASYRETLSALLDQGSYVGIATHDEELIIDALDQIRERGLEREAYEFQMLLGVRERRGDELVRAGHRVRVYLPFGVRWYEYSIRRLQENPAIAGYIALGTLGRLRRWRSPAP